MNRIDKTIKERQTQGQTILSPYITAGDPEPGMTVGLMHALVEGGADILEIGIPFSDPMAEGPVIQAAMERALAHHVHCENVLDMIAAFRKKDDTTPVILMGYLNPVEQYGYERFAKKARDCGVDGTILVDMPPEESNDLSSVWEQYGLHCIYLCSPTTDDKRLALINRCGQGYVYFVSLKGVTGAEMASLEAVKTRYLHCKQQIQLPIMVGFGIKTPDMAANIASFADGVIIGAALIQDILTAYQNQNDVNQAATRFIHNIRCAMPEWNKHHD